MSSTPSWLYGLGSRETYAQLRLIILFWGCGTMAFYFPLHPKPFMVVSGPWLAMWLLLLEMTPWTHYCSSSDCPVFVVFCYNSTLFCRKKERALVQVSPLLNSISCTFSHPFTSLKQETLEIVPLRKFYFLLMSSETVSHIPAEGDT